MKNGKCNAGNEALQIACLALQSVVQFVVKDLGAETVEQLSSDYEITWNPEQRIGSCRVTGIAGTYFNFPIPESLLPNYYNPSDGLVGEGSALARASQSVYGTKIPAPGIPNFKEGGSFPVVHGTSFAWLSDKNLLNQANISALVVSTLQTIPLGSPNCTASTTPSGPLTNRRAKLTIPLQRFLAPAAGTLPRPRRGDAILFKGARLRCRGRRVRSTAFPGHRRLRVAIPRCKRRLRVRGSGDVLLIRTVGKVGLRIRKRVVRVDVKGVDAEDVVLSFDRGRRFAPIALSPSGRGLIPKGTGPDSLRLVVTTEAGARLIATATVSR
jgi:hypothetical protein